MLGDSGNDFVGSSQVARYGPREQGVTSVTFTINDDLEPEPDELFYLRLDPLDPTVRVGPKNSMQVIVRANDDAYGVFSIDEVSCSESLACLSLFPFPLFWWLVYYFPSRRRKILFMI